LKIAVKSVDKLKKEQEKIKAKQKKDEDAKEKLLSDVFKTSVKMKEESDLELLERLAEKVAEIFTDSLSSDSKKGEEKKKDNEKYAKDCQSHFEKKYKELKLNYPQLYSYLGSNDLLNELLSQVDNNPTN